MSQYDTIAAVDPLTRRNSAGETLQRDPRVEEQIASALALDEAGLVARARRAAEGDSDYLQEEALVYLIRHYSRRKQYGPVEALSEVLIGRTTRYISGKARSLGPASVQDCYQDIVTELLDHVYDLHTNRADYLEVRFWLYLRRLSADVMRRYYRENKRERQNDSLDLAPDHGDDGDELPILAKLAAKTPGPEQQLMLRDALAALDEPLRTAFVLRYYVDLPVEDADPRVPTISKHFGKTPRTIRNWFKEIDRVLLEWQGEEQWAK